MATTPPHGERPLVMVIDDDPDIRRLVECRLGDAGLDCLLSGTGEEGLRLARTHAERLDGILLDIMMPDLTGFEVLRRLKDDPDTAPIAVLVFSAHATADDDIVHAVESGAVDHLAKPFSGPVLVAKIRAMCERTREARALRERLRQAELEALVDPLTGLGNRRDFERQLEECERRTAEQRVPLALIVIDIDRFKTINDTYGHETGDRVLCEVARYLQDRSKPFGTVHRLGGEEFVVIAQLEFTSALAFAEDLRTGFLTGSHGIRELEGRSVTFSAGVASADPSNGFAIQQLLSRADQALYAAKRGGRNRVAGS